MSRVQLDPTLQRSINAVENERVQEIARELAKYGLGIALPHIHDGVAVSPLPPDKIQYENELAVSFLDRTTFAVRAGAFPVAWRYDENERRVIACAWCHDT